MAVCTGPCLFCCLLCLGKSTSYIMGTFDFQGSRPQDQAHRSARLCVLAAMAGLYLAYTGCCELPQCNDGKARPHRPPGSGAAASAVKHDLLQPHNLHLHDKMRCMRFDNLLAVTLKGFAQHMSYQYLQHRLPGNLDRFCLMPVDRQFYPIQRLSGIFCLFSVCRCHAGSP